MQHGGNMRRCWLGTSIGLLVLLAGLLAQASATHEVTHRFTVYGSVRNGSTFPGVPLAGKEVIIRDAKTGQVLQRGTTDQRGKFALLLHMHNRDLGRRIIVQTDGVAKTITLQFDPDDTTTERRARVDLVLFPQ